MITGESQVMVDVDEQEQAKRFWTEVIGLTVATDAPYGEAEGRLIELVPPDGQPLLVLRQVRDGRVSPRSASPALAWCSSPARRLNRRTASWPSAE
jgi:catechol-2,3-dioxygenase